VKFKVEETTEPDGFWIQAFKKYFVSAKTPNFTKTSPLSSKIDPFPKLLISYFINFISFPMKTSSIIT